MNRWLKPIAHVASVEITVAFLIYISHPTHLLVCFAFGVGA